MPGKRDSVIATTITTTSISTYTSIVPPVTTTTWPPMNVTSDGRVVTAYNPSLSTIRPGYIITSLFPTLITTVSLETISGTPSPTNSKTVTAGAAGGIAVVCFFVGVAIASFLVYFIISRRERRYRYSHFNDGSEDPRGPGRAAEKSLASATISIPQDSSAAIVENHLPQPVEDNAIKSELSKLKDRVNDHIQSYYDLAKMREPVAAQDIQRALGNVSSVPLEKFSRLLADPRTRPVILRNGLAWIILSRVGLECDPSISFLPRHVVSCVHDMLQARMNDGGKLVITSS